MTGLSTLPFLVAALGAFWLWLAVRSVRHRWISNGGLAWVALWLAGLGVWGRTTSHLALSGSYQTAAFYGLLPGLWLPLVPIVLTLTLIAASPTLRQTLLAIASRHTRALVFVHTLRIAAVGSVIKAATGDFPLFFAYLVALPDLLFGLSALALIASGKWRTLTPHTLMIWNLIGIAVILPAPLLIQLGLPGSLHTFTDLPDAQALFAYPMVLAPTLVVPFFITMNAIHAAAIWASGQHRTTDLKAAAAS